MSSKPTKTANLTEIARHAARIYNEQGVTDEFVALTAPDCEIIAPPQWPEESIYRGHAGVRKVFAAWDEQFKKMHIELDSIHERDGRLLVLGRMSGRARHEDLDLAMELSWLSDFTDDGLIKRQQYWFSWDEGRRAFGL